MEHMLNFINSLKAGPYSDVQNQIIADYLTGKVPFEKVKPFLRRENYGLNTSAAHEIGRAVAKERALFPALGRFIRILKIALPNRYFISFLIEVSKCGPSFEEIYVGGDIGAGAMIVDVLTTLCDCNWMLKPKTLGYDSYTAFFESIYQKYPEHFELLTNERVSASFYMFARMYLYSRDKQRYGKFADSILACGASVIGMNASFNAAAFDAAKKEPAFKNTSDIKTLEKLMRKDKNDWTKISDEDKKTARFMFCAAYILADKPEELFDFINYIYIYHSHKSLPLGRTFNIFNGGNDADIFRFVRTIFDRGVFPKDKFFARYSQTAATASKSCDFSEEFYALALDNEAAALDSIEIATDLGAAFLARAFFEKGMHLELLPQMEQRLMNQLFAKSGKNEAAEKWFLGQSESDAEDLPKIELPSHHNFQSMIALLCKFAKSPARIFEYVIVQKECYWFKRGIEYIIGFFGEKTAENFLDGLNRPTEEKVAILIDSYIEEWGEESKVWLKAQISRIVGNDILVMEKAFKTASAKGRALILETVYKDNPDYKPDWLLECMSDGSKMVRDLAVAYLTPKKELKEQIEPLTKAKKKAVRECAEKLMLAYNAEDVNGSEFNALAYCIQNLPGGASKTIAWTEFDSLPKIRLAESETLADDRIVQGYIYLFVTQTEMAVPAAAIKIRQLLCREDLRVIGQHLYNIWKKNGAVAKQRGVLVLAAIDGDDDFVRTLRSDLQGWADASRGQLAADAVRAMALQGGDLALMTVDGISKKFNNKQVKRAGEEAFLFAAEQLNIDPEVLADKIVPSLGFDERGQQIIDYGTRQFTATITPSLVIEVKNSDGKMMKSLPSPGSKDDEDKAKAAKAGFAVMKKNLKSVVGIQCLRLEQALSTNRTWMMAEWRRLFVENPIMHMFAIGLIWGTYDDNGKITLSFRYMEDGTFTDAEENEITISEDSAIGLCHPLDLGEALTSAWKTQLEDYEITQPIEQLERKVFVLTEKDKDKFSVTEFGGAVMYAVSLLGKLQKLGWYKGSVQDAGGYQNFYKEDKKQNIGVWLNFSGTYVGVDTTEEVTVYDAIFYKAGTVQYGSYVYDEIAAENKLKLGEIPARLYSEICYDLERTTVGRIRTVDKW